MVRDEHSVHPPGIQALDMGCLEVSAFVSGARGGRRRLRRTTGSPPRSGAITWRTRTASVVSPEGPPWRAFQNQARNTLELLKAASRATRTFSSRVAIDGEANIDCALREGKGLILTTYHAGNWELAGLVLALRGYPLTTIAGEQLRPGWSEQVKRLKERFGMRMIRTGGEIRKLYGDIRSNRAIVLHIDGDVFTGGYDVSFLGRTVTVPRGPAHLSRVLSCPLSLAYCRRTPGSRLVVTIEPAVTPPADAAGELRLTRASDRSHRKMHCGRPWAVVYISGALENRRTGECHESCSRVAVILPATRRRHRARAPQRP